VDVGIKSRNAILQGAGSCARDSLHFEKSSEEASWKEEQEKVAVEGVSALWIGFRRGSVFVGRGKSSRESRGNRHQTWGSLSTDEGLCPGREGPTSETRKLSNRE